MLLCCFYSCHKIGKLVLKNDKSLFDWRKVIKCSSLIFSNGHIQYCLPYHKSNPFYHGTDVLFTPQDITDPVALLTDYVSHHEKLHGATASLFLCKDGSHPSWSWFDSKFFSVLDHSFGRHSACARGATYYASLGCWSSSAWNIYIRENPIIHAEL